MDNYVNTVVDDVRKEEDSVQVDYIINYYYKSPHKKAQGLKVLGKTPALGT